MTDTQSETSDEKKARGTALARRLFKGAGAGGTQLPQALADYTMAHVFGDVWHQDDLALEERSLVTCAMLVALNREAEQRLHFVAARNLGIPRSRIEGVITQAAHYAGWPCAVSAVRVLNEVWPAAE